MVKQKDDTTTEAPATEEAKPKRRIRTYEERIAELQAQAEKQANRRRTKVEKDLASAKEQQAEAKAKLERIDTRVAELEAELTELTPDEIKDAGDGTEAEQV